MKIIIFNGEIIGYFDKDFIFFEKSEFFQKCLNENLFVKEEKKGAIILSLSPEVFDEP